MSKTGKRPPEEISEAWIISRFEDSLSSNAFHIFLQPQVNMEGKIYGAEVLSRWFIDNDMLVPVSKYIPVLAKTEKIIKMDEHIWEMAIKQLSKWNDTVFRDLYLSINVEPKDFLLIDVPEKLLTLCKQHDVDVKKLHVEITERGIGTNFPQKYIRSLHGKGFIVEMDDFGKGSNSLAMLRNINVDILKLDMEFIRKTKNRLRSKIVLDAVMRLAEKLQTEVIVEGVETESQKELLKNVGCKMYQGFLFSKPLPVEMFESLTKQKNI